MSLREAGLTCDRNRSADRKDEAMTTMRMQQGNPACPEGVMQKDELHEACGLFGVYDNDEMDVARLTYLGLYAVQHRGQDHGG